MKFKTLAEALDPKTIDVRVRAELAKMGALYLVTAKVVQVGAEWDRQSVEVRSEMGGSTLTSDEYVVMRFGGLTCPVCVRTGERTVGGWVIPGSAAGNFIVGLDPRSCPACFDTLVNNGVTPGELDDGQWTTFSRPKWEWEN